MKQLQTAELSNLVAKNEPCISIYAALSGSRDQDLALLNVQIEQALSCARDSFPIAEVYFDAIDLQPIADAIRSSPLARSVAIFKSPSVSGFVTLEEKLDTASVVADSFHLKPLLTRLQVDFRYYAIWLAEDKISVFAGNAETLEKIQEFSNSGMVDSSVTAANMRSSTKGWEDLSSQSFNLNIKQRINRLQEDRAVAKFYRKTNAEIRFKITKRGMPVVLIGHDRLTGIYKSINRHRTPIVASIARTGSTGPTFGSVHSRVLAILEDMHQRRAATSVFEYKSKLSLGRSIESLPEIAEAAAKGRIKSLFIRSGSALWGKLHRKTGKVIVDQSLKGTGDDLLDDIAEQVLKNRGRVYTLPQHQMPTKEPIAAVLVAHM